MPFYPTHRPWFTREETESCYNRRKKQYFLVEMHRRGFYDSLTLVLSLEEPVTPVPHALPAEAPHLTDLVPPKTAGRESADNNRD
ncbi:MAG: hypothetical protein U5L72_01540 [Bacteroidales bacterium]|nr:hypothetical protein [Bacteroidales bacterium]